MVDKQNNTIPVPLLERTSYWIGYLRDRSSRIFIGNDNSSLIYSNWAKGEPNNYQLSEENCTEIYGTGHRSGLLGKWNDEKCNEKRGFICKKKGGLWHR